MNRAIQSLLLGATVLPLVACSSGGGSSDGSDKLRLADLGAGEATVALGDAGYDDLASLNITIHSMTLSGDSVSADIVEEGVDDPVVIDALAYQDTAAPLPPTELPAGDYDQMSFKLTITAQDSNGGTIRVFPLFDPNGTEYTEIETRYPLNDTNAFTVAEPAEDNQPFLFLHIDVENSVTQGAESDSITIAPALFLSTRIAMSISGTVTEIDTEAELFALEDEEGTTFFVQPTDCTTTILGFDTVTAGVTKGTIFDNIEEGDRLFMDGVLGIDPGCDDVDQRAPLFHPRQIKGDLGLTGITGVEGIVSNVDDDGTTTTVELVVVTSADLGTGDPAAANAGDTFQADFTSTILLSPRGEVRNLTGSADRLQVGEAMVVAVANFASSVPGEFNGTARLAYLRPCFLSGMISAVEETSMVLDADGTKKGSAENWPARAFWEYDSQTPTVEFGEDLSIVTNAASRVHVGPMGGFRLTQVVDPWYDNQLRGPEVADGQNLSMTCDSEAETDIDIDTADLRGYVNHKTGGENEWTVEALNLEISSDATQKFVAWYAGTPACSLPSNNAYLNNPCIATETKHRERIVLGAGTGWVNLGQSGAGKFGTAILNAGSRVPGATIPDGSDVAGWDDVNERLLLGIDFDADMYPFDDGADSCVGLSERVWVDISQAQFMYFSIDPITEEVDFRYLTTYEDFKATVIAMQDASGGTCDPGFHANAGFSFTGLLDKESFELELGATEIVPVIRCISGQVFDGGCVPD